MEIVIWKRWQNNSVLKPWMRVGRIVGNTPVVKNVEVEVILVNDSPWSTIDESKLSAIKQSYKIVVNKKNSGIHQSRVNGINIASCDYILLLDQDDKISENYFESQYEKAMKENADLIIANGVRKEIKSIRFLKI